MFPTQGRRPAGGGWLSFFVVCLCLAVALVDGESLGAVGLPGMAMTHRPGRLFAPQAPLALQVRIEDATGIIAARCYFRYQPGADYVYVDLAGAGGKDYQATLPAPAAGVQEVEYFFLAVNGAHQVVRSAAYVLHRDPLAPASAAGPEGLRIEIKSDLGAAAAILSALATPDAVTAVPVARSERYGLTAGVYQDRAGSGLAAGYFGGFQLDDTGRPFAVEGLGDFAPVAPAADAAAAPVAATAVIGPHIAGMWKGIIYVGDEVTGRHTPYTPLAAMIFQDGGQVTIITSLSPEWSNVQAGTAAGATGPVTFSDPVVGRPQQLIGTMNADAQMLLYDEINEDWSTHWGPATSAYMKLADYIDPPTAENHHPPLLVVELWRDPPSAFLPAIYKLLLRQPPPR